MSPPGERLVTIAGPDAVDPAQVDGALAALWRAAARGGAGADGVERKEAKVTRACLWNLVVYNPKPEKNFDDSEGHGYGLRTLLDEVVPSLPARIIRLELGGKGSKPPPGKEVLAQVAAKCVPHPSGALQIYGEEINLTAYGAKGESHFPSLVRALLQPNLPIAVLWLDDLPHKGWLLEQMLGLSDRLLMDSQSASQEADLAVVGELVSDFPTQFVDIGWMRLTPLRHLIAGFFDGPQGAAQLQALEGIDILATPNARNGALLLAGWLLERAGLSKIKALPRGKEDVAHRWEAARGKSRFPVNIRIHEGQGGADGLLELAIRAKGEHFAIHRVDADTVTLDSPQRVEPHLNLHRFSDAELAIAALGAHGPDSIYPEVLEKVRVLLAAEEPKK